MKKIARNGLGVALTVLVFTGVLGGVASANLNGIGKPAEQQQVVVTPAPDTPTTVTTPEPAPTPTPQPAPTPTPAPQPQEPSNAEVVGDLFSGIGVTAESTQKANELISPYVPIFNFIVATIIAVTGAAVFMLTFFDLMYIAVPFLRPVLNKQGGGGNSSGMSSSHMRGSSPRNTNGNQEGYRFISDEALSVVNESGAGGSNGPSRPGQSGARGNEQPKTKNLLFTYLKRRVVFLALFGVCVVLFSTMVFTDIGISIGNWVLTKLLTLFF